MAGNAILLVGANILCRIEHLGLKASTNSQFGIRYLLATVLLLLTLCANWCRRPPHYRIHCSHRRTWCHVAQAQRRIRLRHFLKHQRLV